MSAVHCEGCGRFCRYDTFNKQWWCDRCERSSVPRISWPDPLPRHLSATSLSMASRCPEQFRHRYILGEKAPPFGALVWGDADHYAIEQSMRAKIDTHEDWPVEDVLDAFMTRLRQSVDEHGGELEIDWGRSNLDEVKDLGARLVHTYHKQVSPLVQPVRVEQKVELTTAGLPVVVIGYLDLETQASVIDRKTSSRKIQRPKPEHRLQGAIYQAATLKPMEWHVGTKTKLPAVYTSRDLPGLRDEYDPVLISRTFERVTNLVRRLSDYMSKYGPDQPWPTEAPNIGWLDDICGSCGWGPRGNNTCHWWATEQRVAA